MELIEEIKKAAEEYVFDVRNVEIATLKIGIVTVWVNGRRFGAWDINKHDFCSFTARV